jgi:gluconate 2-dehydrogenase gamma chain
MGDVSRRDLFRVLGASAALAGTVFPAEAQMAHEAVAAIRSLNGGPNYAPKYFKPHEFRTMRKLADLILPADDRSPAASEAGAAEFIDLLCSRNTDLAEIFDGGLAWLDDIMRRRYSADFLTAKAEEQTALLDMAYGDPPAQAVVAGQQFFNWARRLVVDAYYASPAGVKDLGYVGNVARSEFSVPKEAVEYALKRSPFAGEA